MRTAARIRLAMQGVCSLALLLTLSAAPVRAQSGASTGLAGRVTDSSGAAIPGVTVTITHVDTGSVRTVTTTGTGEWEARFLSPGSYRVTFELSGFKPLRREGISVSTAEMATVDTSLEIGTLAEAVQVVANAEMVSAGSMTVQRTLDQKELEALPTSARNFTQLLVIEPGVSADISELLSNDNASVSPSVNGARTTNNSFVFNGVDVTNLLCCNSRVTGSSGTIDNGGGSLSRNVAPAPETLQEVKLQTSLYDAATGRNGGGNFTLVGKSGTNSFRGSAYYYNQNDALMANDFFFNRAGIEKPILDRHEGGGTIGGPIIRNKTFFFGSYQRTQAETSFVDEASNTILLPRALTDDRSDAGINAFAAAIWDPRHGPVNFGVINPISRALLKATFSDGTYLIPSGSNGNNCRRNGAQLFESCQVTSVIPATFEQDQFTVNVDHQLTLDNRFSGKFFFSDQPSRDPLANSNALTRFEREDTTYQRTFSLTNLHVFSSTVLNEFRAGFFRNRNDSSPVSYFTNAQFGIQNPLDAKVPDLTQLDIRGDRDVGGRVRFGTPSDGTRIYDLQTTYTLGNTLTMTKGKHSIRAGGEMRRHHLDGDLREGQNRRHNFRSWFDFLTVGYRNPSDGNRARQISDSSLTYGETARHYRMTDVNAFIAEDWRITSNLTLNLGLRWEYFGFPWERDGLLAVFDFPAALETGMVQDGFVFASNFDPNSVPGAAGLSLTTAGSKTIVPGDYDNVMPRVGFAWTPFDKKNFVLRGGYGMFYERTTGGFANSLRQAPPFFRELQLNNLGDYNVYPTDFPALPIPSMSVGFDDGEPILVGSNDPNNEFEALETQMVSPDLQTPYLQQWSVNTQWEFMPNWLLEVGYIGTKGSNLLQFINQNQALDIDASGGFLARTGVPGGGFTGNYYGIVNDRFVNLRTPPPGCDLFDDPGECVVPAELRGPLLGLDEDEGANTLYSNGKSSYHGLQTSLQKRFTAGYMFNVNYTFSRSLDYFSDEGLFQIEHDQTRPANNKGLSDYHRKHRLILSWAWDLPFRGNRFLEGWQIAGIGTLQSGRPFTVTDGEFSAILVSTTNPRPNLASGATHDDQTTSGSVNSRLNNYLNRDAFESSGTAFGNLGRNTVMGPDQRRLDVSIAKLTRLAGARALEFRIEAYNVTNTPTFRNPARDISAANFGQITRTRGGPRVIQLGLKFRF
jgi:hypothetical protein